MDRERWRRVETLFHHAWSLSGDERRAFLAVATAGDGELRREVESLLAVDDEPDLLPGGGARASTPDAAGPYRLVRLLGAGGMGSVFLGFRDREPERPVAVKLLAGAGFPGHLLLRRFAQERRILESLEHPNIARLLDGGATAEGVPYLAMEYVDGAPIDDHCDRTGIDLPARLDLFLTVLSAVEHAHRRLVVHRDLKPTNVLVTDDGVPKLIDFGIARLLDPGGTPGTEGTLTRLRPMTPPYASPEQVTGEPITTATDVYALGVILYRLLTGRLPHEVAGRSRREIEAAILGTEPVRPSLAVGRADAERPSSPLRRRLAGDLDAIVMKALRKVPEHRYTSVTDLAEDLRRHRTGRPVHARRGTLRYRTGRFVRRHALAVTAAAVAVITTLGFAGAMARLAGEAAAERDRAAAERDLAQREKQRVTRARELLVDLFALAEPTAGRGQKITVRELLDHGVERVRADLGSEPELQAELLTTLGRLYRQIGLYPPALEVAREALEIRRRVFPADHPETVASLIQLGRIARLAGDYPAAEAALTEAVDLEHGAGSGGAMRLAEALDGLSWLVALRGEPAEAERLAQRALALRRDALGEDHPEVARSLHTLAWILGRRQEIDEAERLLRRAVAIAERSLGAEHPETLPIKKDLAQLLLFERGATAEAERLYRQILAAEERSLEPQHPKIGFTLDGLAKAAALDGRLEEAEQLYRRALEIHRRGHGPDHPTVAATLHNLGRVLLRRGDPQGALPFFQRSVEISRRALPEGSPELAFPLLGLADALVAAGDPAAAEPLLREALDRRRRHLPPGNSAIAEAEVELAECLIELDEPVEAERLLLAARPVLAAHEGSRSDEALRAARAGLAELRRRRPVSR